MFATGNTVERLVSQPIHFQGKFDWSLTRQVLPLWTLLFIFK